MEWEVASDVKRDLREIKKVLNFTHINLSRIYCYRTQGSKAKAYARTWAFPKIFQKALKIEPAYVIEVLSGYYDKLTQDEKKKVLIHELLHIPKNFSGSLLPHRTKDRHLGKTANKLFNEYKRKVTSKS